MKTKEADLKKDFEKFIEKAKETLGVVPTLKGGEATFKVNGKLLMSVYMTKESDLWAAQILVDFGGEQTSDVKSVSWDFAKERKAVLERPKIVNPQGKRSLCDWLNEEGIVVEDGKARIQICGTSGSIILDEPFREVKVVIKPHPEGAKRGGYVPVVSKGGEKVFFDDNDCSWFEY